MTEREIEAEGQGEKYSVKRQQVQRIKRKEERRREDIQSSDA